MRNSALVLGVSIALVSAPQALAWNARGHMAVAVIAWDQMTPPAQARASALLQRNPYYSSWTNGVPAANRDVVAFARAATWPDQIRSDGDYADDQVDSPPTTDGGYQPPRYKHRYWHYKDLPFTPDNTPTEAPPEPNAATQIRALSADLGAPATSDDRKSFALSWLLHLVGDVHQPLHATARYTAALPSGDNGGNKVGVCPEAASQCSWRRSTPLHTFWDAAIGTSSSSASAITKARSMTKATGPATQVSDVDEWLSESQSLARTVVYLPPVRSGSGPYRLNHAYELRAGSYAERRIALAGARLANLLNQTLP
ncbi:S1/P1 nuclease [Phenylobacterium sp. LH3H17]|uniref:S1/P1 nuclease n=1 Tax=Phenylobacterium sp. LH3H17 TaxID=2903901 RepID=UPI0020C9F998|nr:S1/P1 nuclease [Phenylobacterium sp. LH3H17]UTP39769.1 S1/P1 nuclease [Phenylobacterium sp. LH3H17]